MMQMRKGILILVALVHVYFVSAQYKLIIQIHSLPSTANTETVFVAGNFNNWNPHDELCRLKKSEDGQFSISFSNVPAGDYEYKFTKGAWETVETTSDGRQIANRSLKLMSDTTLAIDIQGWSEGKPKVIPH